MRAAAQGDDDGGPRRDGREGRIAPFLVPFLLLTLILILILILILFLLLLVTTGNVPDESDRQHS